MCTLFTKIVDTWRKLIYEIHIQRCTIKPDHINTACQQNTARDCGWHEAIIQGHLMLHHCIRVNRDSFCLPGPDQLSATSSQRQSPAFLATEDDYTHDLLIAHQRNLNLIKKQQQGRSDFSPQNLKSTLHGVSSWFCLNPLLLFKLAKFEIYSYSILNGHSLVPWRQLFAC